ncbi:MAG: N-acetylglucosamine-6-phosphate deacetylase [Cyanobacteria bacterium J06631_9]
MSDSTVILNARLPQRRGLYQISIQQGVVTEIGTTNQPDIDVVESGATALDVAGDWVTLGAIDLQINGALGLAFPDLRADDFDQLVTICELLWRQGVDGFCPTLVTTTLENFRGSLAAIQAYQHSAENKQGGRSQVLGAHLEGPFLNAAKRGAHPAEYLQPLTLERVKTVAGEFTNAVSILTLAPELVEAEALNEVMGWLRSHNITISLGHSLATAQQATYAFDLGATMVTHTFNAMPGLHHRKPGLLGSALTDSRAFCGFIADGQHICPAMLDLLLRVGRGSTDTRMGGLFLVSDALSPLGLPDGKYPWDSREIEVVDGTARLADGTLSGTTLPLIEGAVNLVKWGICDAEDAIALVTLAPRKALGLPVLSVGASASLIRWSQDDDSQLIWQRLSA